MDMTTKIHNDQEEYPNLNLDKLRMIDKFIRSNGKVQPHKGSMEFPIKVDFEDGSYLESRDYPVGLHTTYTKYTLADKNHNELSFNISAASLAYSNTMFDDNHTNEIIDKMEFATHQRFKEEDNEIWYSSIAFLQPGEEGTYDFERLADEGKYEEVLALAQDYDYGDEIELRETRKSSTHYSGDDVLAENDSYAVIVNNSVGGSIDIRRKNKTEHICEVLRHNGYRGFYFPEDASDDVKELAKRMRQEDITNSYNNEQKYVNLLGEGFHFVAPADHYFQLVDADNDSILKVTGVDIKNGRLLIHIDGRPDDEASVAMETIDQTTWKEFGAYLSFVKNEMDIMLSGKQSPELTQVLLHNGTMVWPTNLENLDMKTLQSLTDSLQARVDKIQERLKDKDAKAEYRVYANKELAMLKANINQIDGAVSMKLRPVYEHLGLLQHNCEMFLSSSKGDETKLSKGNIAEEMKELRSTYNCIPQNKKPLWINRNTINEYHDAMIVMDYMKKNPKKGVSETSTLLSAQLGMSRRSTIRLMEDCASALLNGSDIVVSNIRKKGIDFYKLNTALSLTSSELLVGGSAEFDKLVKSKDQKAIMDFYEKHYDTKEINGHYLYKESTPLIGEQEGTSKVIAENKNGKVLHNKETGTYDYYRNFNYAQINHKFGSSALQERKNYDWADPSDDLIDILQDIANHEHDNDRMLKEENSPEIVTVNGDGISDVRVTDDYGYYHINSKVNGNDYLNIPIREEDAKAFYSHSMTIEELAQKYYPWKFEKHLTPEQIKNDTVLSDGRKIEKFAINHEGANYTVSATVGNKQLRRYIGQPTLMAIKEGVVSPRILVEQNFGQELHLKGFYDKYKLPEGVKINDITVRKDAAGEYLISADLGKNGHTREHKMYKEDVVSLMVAKTASKEQLAAYYLKEDFKNTKVENKRSQSRNLKI